MAGFPDPPAVPAHKETVTVSGWQI